MTSLEQHSELARMATTVRKAFGSVHSPRDDSGLLVGIIGLADHAARVAPECAVLASSMRESARIYLGKDRRSADRYAGGQAALRATIAGTINKILAFAAAKGGAARLGTEHPSPRVDNEF